jgi:hypothetical protein
MSKATTTAKSGPGVQSTAVVVDNIIEFDVDLVKRVIHVRSLDHPNRVIDYDLVGVTTFSAAISGGNWTLTIS